MRQRLAVMKSLLTAILLTAALPAQQTILCVGDSVTFGTGAAREDSYPAQLGRLLPKSRVINAGWPGRNSRVTLERFGDYLNTFSPTHVVLLVGANDAWSEPERLILKPSGKPRPASKTAPTLPFIGDWHTGPLDLEILANGSFIENGTETFWYLKGEDLIVRRNALDCQITWQCKDGKLQLKGPWPAELVLTSGPAPSRSALRRAWQKQRELPQTRPNQKVAKKLFEACLKNPLEEGKARLGLIAIGQATKKSSLTQQQLKWFEKRARKLVHPKTQEELFRAYEEARAYVQLVGLACDEITRDPHQYPPWEVLARHGNDPRFRKDFEKALTHALKAVPAKDPLRVNLLRARGSIQRFDDRDASIRDLMASILLDAHDSHLVLEIRRTKGVYNRKMFERQLKAMKVNAAQTKQLKSSFDRALRKPSARPSPVLSSHLEQMAKMCRASGIELTLLTYPYHAPAIEKVTAKLARRRLGAQIDVQRHFKKLGAELGAKSYHEYYVLDGHPNGAGYAKIAKLVAAEIKTRSR